MEGPTSSGGSRNRLTCLTLQEHDDDDEDTQLIVTNIRFCVQQIGIFCCLS